MKTCIITGAGSGIGRETAILLSYCSSYDNFALLGRNRKDLEETLKLMNQSKVCGIYEIDLIDQRQIPHIIDNLYNDFKSIDCLLNIAGYTDPQPLLSTSLESLQITYAVNVFSPLILIKECVKYMKDCNNGKILNIASTAGMSARPGWLSYSSSKASLISISKTLTDELAEYGIKVYCISPGRCATNLRKKLAPEEDSSTIMQPIDVAKVIVKLVDDEENCLDGQNIIVRKKI